MLHVRLSAITIAGAIVTTIIVGVVMVSRPARAQSTGKAECTEQITSPSKMQAWMNQELAAGRTHFIAFTAFCAW
ncbi:MAG: hypothetical protein DMD33_18510 [Gemmatimonadetes bacterium]|nr:MAG: hypothetical protein DMD33_18510 [Gemmatimonadota bacterium]